jgi:hypothetical protein
MRQAIAIVALAAALGISGCSRFLCIACDGYLGATGQVYERLDAPSDAKSLAVVDTATLDDHRVSPLVGAEITLEPWTPRSQPQASNATIAKRQTVTDKDGHFRVGGTVRPGNFQSRQPFLSHALGGEDIALEEVGDGIWNIVYYSTILGKIDERTITGI